MAFIQKTFNLWRVYIMITLTKSLALVAMQASLQSANLAHVVSFCSDAKIISVNDEKLVAIFKESSMLVVECLDDSDESQHELSFKIDFDSSFIDFVVLADETYKTIELADDIDSLEELYSVVEDFGSNQSKLFDLLISEYSYSYDIETLVNYAAENACIFEGSRSDYAYELIEDCYDTKSMGNLANYIDYDSFGRDLELEGSIQEIAYNVYWANCGDIY